jgi:predicted nucleic acid-binding protein
MSFRVGVAFGFFILNSRYWMAFLRVSLVVGMPDRIIAVTAIHLNLPLVKRDGKIRSSNVKTIW